MLSSADRHHPGKRLAKVLVPYAAWTLAYVLASNLSQLGRVPMAYLKGLLLGNSAPMMYYVFVYCELTLMIPLVDVMARSRWRLAGLAVSPLEVVLFRLSPLVNGIAIAGPFAAVQRLSCLGWFSYFYLGYLLGNGLMEVRVSTKMLAVVGGGSLILQALEGWWQLSMGVANCGTQLKLSSLLTGAIVVLLAYRYVLSETGVSPKTLRLLGDHSFGIYFSHIAIMSALGRIPWYAERVVYPLNAIVTILASLAFCSCAHALLGRYGRYLAL